MTRPFWLAIAILTSFTMATVARADVPTNCAISDNAGGPASPLPHVASVLRPGDTLNVLAIGSANLFRPEASFAPGSLMNQATGGAKLTNVPPAQVITEEPSGTAFPQRMANSLEKLVPGVTVKVTTRGGRGLSAADQLAMLSEAIGHEKFQLVLWQTGTVEAVRNLPPSDFAQTLADGVEKSTQAGADVVLIDPQFSRFLQTNSNIDPYQQAFQVVGSMPSVTVFHRFDLMRNWVNDGQIDLERTPKANRTKAVQHLHECLGSELARLVLSGAHSQ